MSLLVLLYDCTNWTLTKSLKKKNKMGTTQRCCMLSWTNPGNWPLQNSNCTATYHPFHKPSKWDKQDMLGTAGEVRINLKVMFSLRLLHVNTPVLANQQKLTFINSGRCREDLPRLEKVKKENGQERVKGICEQNTDDKILYISK